MRLVVCDHKYCEGLRKSYPEDTEGMTDEELVEEYNHGRKYQCLWDNVGDAYYDFERLADAYLKLKAELESLRNEGLEGT